MKKSLINAGYTILPGVALVLFLFTIPLAVHIGEWITPTGSNPSWDLATLTGQLFKGKVLWPGAATIATVVSGLLIFGAYIWVRFVRPDPGQGTVHGISGLPHYADLAPRMGQAGALAKARQALKLPKDATDEDIVVALCLLEGKVLYVQHEDSMWVFAPQRSGKTLFLAVGMVVDAPGPVITTSTKVDLFMLTALMRSGDLKTAKPVLVFDLQDMTNWPGQVRWSPVDGCEDPDEALARGKAWAGAQPMNGVKGGDWFNSKASAILGRYLHAAALDGKTMLDVLRWANDFTNTEPLEILQKKSRGHGFAERLEALTTSRAGETVDSIQETLAGLLEPLSSPKAMHTLTPAPGQGFDVETFLNSNGTLYLLADGETSPVAPIVTMFADHLFRKSQRISQTKPGGRLWPPLTMVLDEAANVAAFPEMASALSDSGGRGIRIVGFSQSFAQNRQRWGDMAAKSIRGTSSVRMYLPGLEELDELDKVAAAAGLHMVERSSRSVGEGKVSVSYRSDEVPVIRGYQIQQLDVGEAFMHYSNIRPAIVKLVPWWKRPDADTIRERKNELELELRTTPQRSLS